MLSEEFTLSLLWFLIAFTLATAASYAIKAGIGYLLWYARNSDEEIQADFSIDISEFDSEARLKVIDGDRVTATRLSTLVPRWMISTTAVESLTELQQRCLLTHIITYIHSRGRLIHNSTIGFGIVLVLFAPQVTAALPLSIQRSVPLLGYLIAITFILFCLPLIERWLLYRADRRAAETCGIETYVDFLETTARIEPDRSWWYALLEPSPQTRASKLRNKAPN